MKTKITFVRGIIIAIIAAVVLSPYNPAEASIAGANRTARALFHALEREGWTVRDTFERGLLRRGQSVVIRTTLYSGVRYKIVAAGCEDAYDVDIAVYDENGNFIDGDNDHTALAVADVAPRWTGTFFIKVTMYNSTPDGAHYVVQYAYD